MYNSEIRQAWPRRALLLAAIAMLASLPAWADERILSYDSVIEIHRDGGLTVAETIEVRAEGNDIRRGIYRDFPTDYRDHLGNRYQVRFDVASVRRDGHPEAWHSRRQSNGVRVYIGSADRFLDPGVYRYRLEYHTDRQLGFFEQHDELYWNVTGLDWAFPIDRATVTIRLPETVSADSLALDQFTGTYGSIESNARGWIADGRTVQFETTAMLPPRHGLTVVAAFPKGIVHEPEFLQEVAWFLADNAAAAVMLAGLIIPLLWYLWVWNRHGRDPEPGTIIPRFKPPSGLSPAAARYVSKMSFDNKAFTAAVVSLAVKGWLNIIEKDGEFTLERIRGRKRQQKPTPGERAVLNALLPGEGRSIVLDDKNHSEFQEARSGLHRELKAEHLGRLFQLNRIFTLPAVVMTLLAAAIAGILAGSAVQWIVFGIMTVTLHVTFARLLRAPTIEGRSVMDEVDGLKMYLDTAEQDRLDRMRSPQLTPEVFETFLPYAFALGVENNWCERFSRVLPQLDPDSGTYRPRWYSGRHRGLDSLDHLGSKFVGQLSSAISSASTPPGSSSGSGGGGFSGGGGGGGGGGGW